jgi:Ca2+-binding EF-hand superfamily protein
MAYPTPTASYVTHTIRLALLAAGLVAAGVVYAHYHIPQKKSTGALQRSNARRGRRTENGEIIHSSSSPQNSGVANRASRPVILNAQIDADGNETDTEADTDVTSAFNRVNTHGNLRELVYFIAELQSQQNTVTHRGITCNGCRMSPIRGIRYKCLNCADVDYCSDCEAVTMHPKTHLLCAIKIPAPYIVEWQPRPVEYPREMIQDERLRTDSLQKLHELTQLDKQTINTLFEQFKTLATLPYHDDPHRINLSVSLEAFQKVMYPHSQYASNGTNILHQQVFNCWANDAGVLGFEEFLLHVSKHRSEDEDVKRRIIFDALDLDSDGYVTRKDFIRMFQALQEDQRLAAHHHLVTVVAKRQEQRVETADVHYPLMSNARSYVDQFYLSDRTIDRPELPAAKHLDSVTTDLINSVDERLKSVAIDVTVPARYRIRDGKKAPEFDPFLRKWLQDRRNIWQEDKELKVARIGITESETDIPSTTNMLATANEGPLSRAVRAGFNEILDPMFELKERNISMIEVSRLDRQRMRANLAQNQKSPSIEKITVFTLSDMEEMTTRILDRGTNDSTWPQYRPNSDADLDNEHTWLTVLDELENSKFGILPDGRREASLSFQEFCDVVAKDRHKKLTTTIWPWLIITHF